MATVTLYIWMEGEVYYKVSLEEPVYSGGCFTTTGTPKRMCDDGIRGLLGIPKRAKYKYVPVAGELLRVTYEVKSVECGKQGPFSWSPAADASWLKGVPEGVAKRPRSK